MVRSEDTGVETQLPVFILGSGTAGELVASFLHSTGVPYTLVEHGRNAEVVSIDLDTRCVTLRNGAKMLFRQLVSTLDLTVVCRLIHSDDPRVQRAKQMVTKLRCEEHGVADSGRDRVLDTIHDALARKLVYTLDEWSQSNRGSGREGARQLANTLSDELRYSLEELDYKHNRLRPDVGIRHFLEDTVGPTFCQAAQQLRDCGLVELRGLFAPALVEQMREDVYGWLQTSEAGSDRHVAFDGANPIGRGHLATSPALGGVIFHPAIVSLLMHYWGADPRVAMVREYWIGPIETYRDRAFEEHVDGHGPEIKVMLLLDDVPADGQRMRVWAGTHRIDWGIRSSLDTRFDASELTACFGPPENCCGSRGTVFLFDTNNAHSGTRNLGPERFAVTFNITPGVRLYPLPELHESVSLGDYEWAMWYERECPVDPRMREAYAADNADRVEAELCRSFVPMSDRRRSSHLTRPTQLSQYVTSPPGTSLFTLHAEEQFLHFLHRSLALPLVVYNSDHDRVRDIFLGHVRDRWLTEAHVRRIVGRTTGTLVDGTASEYAQGLSDLIDAFVPERFNLLVNLRAFVADMRKMLDDRSSSLSEVCSALAFLVATSAFCHEVTHQSVFDDFVTQGLALYRQSFAHLALDVRGRPFRDRPIHVGTSLRGT